MTSASKRPAKPVSALQAKAHMLAAAFGRDPEFGNQGRLLYMLCEPVARLSDACELVDAIGDYNDFKAKRVKADLAKVWDHVALVTLGRSSSPIMFIELRDQWDLSPEQRRQLQEDVANTFTADEVDLVSSAGFYGRHVCSLERDLSHFDEERQQAIRVEQDACERNPFDRTIRLWWD